jgi:hypothetical protein
MKGKGDIQGGYTGVSQEECCLDISCAAKSELSYVRDAFINGPNQ